MELIDAHVHLQPHGEQPPIDALRIELYVERALASGLTGLVITEHLFRFREAYERLQGWWDSDPNPAMRAATAAYWADHVNLELPEYVRLIEQAKLRRLPVRLGLELDWIPGREDDLRAILAPYDWDLVLGSVHWVGAFGFDIDEMLHEWERRDVDEVYDGYASLIEQLAASRLADVLAHPDVPKVFGYRSSDPAAFHARLVAAALSGDCAIEINTNGLRKPVAELYPAADLLRRAHAAGLPVTLASDAHVPERLGQFFDRAIAAARDAGYDGYVHFRGRQPTFEPFGE